MLCVNILIFIFMVPHTVWQLMLFNFKIAHKFQLNLDKALQQILLCFNHLRFNETTPSNHSRINRNTSTPNRPSLVGDNQKNQVANNWLIYNDPNHWDDFYDAKGSAQKVQIDKLIFVLLWTWIFLGVLNSSPGVLLNFDALIPFQKDHLFTKNIQVYGFGLN